MAIIFTLRIVLGLVMLVSGLLKITSLKKFAAVVRTYKLLPNIIVAPASYALVFGEIIIGVAILASFQLKYTVILAMLMQFAALVFTTATLIKHKKMEDCGCFGVLIKVPVTWWHVVANVVLIILALLIFFMQ